MAQYTPTLRSSYFRVKDVAAFKAFCERFGLELTEHKLRKRDTVYGFKAQYGENTLTGSFYDGDEEQDIEAQDFLQALSAHLQDGWVAVITEIGATDILVLRGVAVALNNRGETKWIDLYDIYASAAQSLGEHITPCEELS